GSRGMVRLAEGEPGAPGWHAAVLENKKFKDNDVQSGLELMTVIEKDEELFDRGDHLHGGVRPTFAWFSGGTREAPATPVRGLRFYPLYDYAAPAWSLDYKAMPSLDYAGGLSQAWPKDQKPVVSVWWRTDPLGGLGVTTLTRGQDYKSLADLAGRTVG